MSKLSTLAKFSVVLGTSVSCLAFVSADQAYGLIPVLKNAAKAPSAPKPEAPLRNWGLENSENSSINARKAWRISKGSKRIVVAIIDTGIDPNHADLKDNICRQNGEYGFDFVTNKKNPGDAHGHGSHVAGIVGGSARNPIGGASGVAPNICIMAVRYYSDTASGAQNLANTVKAINYAVDHGANVINYSGGGAEFSAAEMKAIQRAEAKGVVFVAAAGNEYQDTDKSGNAYFPAAYGLSNIIAVAGTNQKSELLPSSNWGKKHVHVAAPGENIYSTLPKGRYGYLTGTSQATAFVSGLAALILSEIPGLKPYEVRDIIMKTVDKTANLEGKIASGGKINAYNALRMVLARREGKNSRTLAFLDKQDREEAARIAANANGTRVNGKTAVSKTIQAIRAVSPQ